MKINLLLTPPAQISATTRTRVGNTEVYKNFRGQLDNPKGPAVLRRADNPEVISGKEPWKEWWREGKRHREDGPALLYLEGEIWYQNGLIHREDGPAQTWSQEEARKRGCEKESWWKEGEKHRSGGPAQINPDGSREWIQRGLFHREDGPARFFSEGEEWWKEGEKHRSGGPAVITHDRKKEWWLYGKLHREGGPAREFTKEYALQRGEALEEWWREGDRHRLGRAAVIYPDGGEEWWKEGKKHNPDGPAIIRSEAVAKNRNLPIEEWWFEDKRHRTDGPATLYPDGKKEWALWGRSFKDNEIDRDLWERARKLRN